jgi:hypothetical protein
VESDSRVWAPIIISTSETTPGWVTVAVQNPDATISREVNSFLIMTREAAVAFNNIWLDNNKYLAPSSETPTMPRTTINPQPRISFEVTSNYGLTTATLNARVLTHYTDQYGEEQYIITYLPTSALTAKSTMEINVSYQVPDVLPTGEVVDFILYAEDLAGNNGLQSLLVSVAQPIEEGIPSWNPPTPAGGLALFLPRRNTWDPETEASFPATIILTPGTSITDFTIKIIDYRGSLVWSKRIVYGATASDVTVSSTQNGFVTKYNFNINASELAPYLSTGVYLVLIYDNLNGKLLAKNTLVIAPSSMR